MTARKKRRWWQFSLRMVMLAMLCVAVFFGGYRAGGSSEKQRAAVMEKKLAKTKAKLAKLEAVNDYAVPSYGTAINLSSTSLRMAGGPMLLIYREQQDR